MLFCLYWTSKDQKDFIFLNYICIVNLHHLPHLKKSEIVIYCVIII